MLNTKIKLLLVTIIISLSLSAQITTDTLILNSDSNGQDAMVGSSGMSRINFGSMDLLNVSHDNQLVPVIYRSFIDFDLSNIPTNAIIIDAKLYLTNRTVDTAQSFGIYFERVDSVWNNATISWDNQSGSYTSDAVIASSPNLELGATQEFNLTSHVQNMVNYPYNNNGWLLRLDDESLEGDYGLSFHSSNSSEVDLRPKLIVNYVLPMQFTSVIKHCTSGNSDGEVDLTITRGSGSYGTYWLRKIDIDTNTTSGTIITTLEATQAVDNVIIDATNLDPGLYWLQVRDSLWTNTSYGNKHHAKSHAFLVGREGEVTKALISTSLLVDASQTTKNMGASAATNDYENINWRDVNPARLGVSSTGTNSYGANVAYLMTSLINIHLNIDDQLEYSRADLRLGRWTAYFQTSTSSNETNLTAVVEGWDQNFITWNSRPSVDTNQRIILPPTANLNGNTWSHDTVDILPFFDYWKTNPNYGFEMELASYNYPRGAHRGQFNFSTNRTYLEMTFTVKLVLTASYDETKDEGTITVNAPEGELPYTYLLSYQPIPDLISIWDNIKDSTEIDSLFFFQGKENSTSFLFDGLQAEKYYVGVFDNNGQEIYQGSTIVGSPVVTSYVSSDIVVNSNVYTLTPNSLKDGQIILDGCISENRNGSIDFTINRLDEFMMGFNKYENETVESVRDYLFGFNVSSSGGLTIYNSGISVGTYAVTSGDELTLAKEGLEFVLYKNNVVLHVETINNNSYDDLKTEFSISKGVLPLEIELEKYIKQIWVPVTFNENLELDCSTEEAKFAWYIKPNLLNVDPNSIQVSIQEVGGGNNYSGSGQNGVIIVLEGVYVVVFSWTNAAGTVSQSSTSQFIAGNIIHWNIINDMNQLSSTTNSISNNVWWGGSNVGNAISVNQLNDSNDGWVSFNVKTYDKKQIGNISYKFSAFGSVGLKNGNNDQMVKVTISGMGYGIINKYVSVRENTMLNTSFIMNGEGAVKIEKIGNTINVYDRNGIQRSSFITPISGDLKVFGTSFSSVIYDTYTSFCNGLTSDNDCAHLNYELNGNYYYTNTGRFCFVYNEEYNDQNIEFNIYDINNNIVATEADFTLLPLVHGENRVLLDFTNYPCISPNSYYVLEVINDKGEKFYLRFYNISSQISQQTKPVWNCY